MQKEQSQCGDGDWEEDSAPPARAHPSHSASQVTAQNVVTSLQRGDDGSDGNDDFDDGDDGDGGDGGNDDADDGSAGPQLYVIGRLTRRTARSSRLPSGAAPCCALRLLGSFRRPPMTP